MSRTWGYWLILGLYLTLRGYHSLDGDQAYRLPLLLHAQDPALYSRDPFVTAFDQFNPHQGSLLALGGATALLGLSGGIFALFLATFLLTCGAVDRLARDVWAGQARAAGWVAIALILTAKAGNIGTNHLFEAMLLDRLMAMAAGWWAIAWMVGEPQAGWWRAGAALVPAAIIHPSLGLQFALVVAGTWIALAFFKKRSLVSWGLAARGIAAAGLAVLPGLLLNLDASGSIQRGLSPEDFWTLSVELQSPQHMLPHLWRMPQWLAWGAYLVLAATAMIRTPEPSVPRVRLALMLAVMLAWLAGSWFAIEVLRSPRMTIFQPFRLATVARGLCLVLVSGRLVGLWSRGSWFARTRAVLIGVALAGDWMLVAVTLAELGATTLEHLGERFRRMVPFLYGGILTWGLFFLSRHDTESGHWPLLLALGACLLFRMFASVRRAGGWLVDRVPSRPGLTLALAWSAPVLALVAGVFPVNAPGFRGLSARCRLVPVAVDDVERLGVWCREHTPVDARFIGPPGPKTFRLWSRRSLAFNRAGSPYHAEGLADWFARFQDHVDLHVPPAEFVRAYVAGRHRLEARYDALDETQLVDLAVRQGADHVIAAATTSTGKGRLERLHAEGRYAVYRLASGSGPASTSVAAIQRQRHR